MGSATLLSPGRNRTKGRVWLVGAPPDAIVVKDISACPSWMKVLFARRLLARETRAYRALEGIGGVPRLLPGGAEDTLVMSHIEGTALPRLPPESLSEALFERLASLVAEIHARGVACGDIHHRNVIVSASGAVHLVDFALATVRRGRGRRGAPSGWLFRRLADLDNAAVVRMRLRYVGRAPTPEEQKVLARGAWLWRAGRLLKRATGARRHDRGSPHPAGLP